VAYRIASSPVTLTTSEGHAELWSFPKYDSSYNCAAAAAAATAADKNSTNVTHLTTFLR